MTFKVLSNLRHFKIPCNLPNCCEFLDIVWSMTNPYTYMYHLPRFLRIFRRSNAFYWLGDREKSPVLHRLITHTTASDTKKVMYMVISLLIFGLRHNNIPHMHTAEEFHVVRKAAGYFNCENVVCIALSLPSVFHCMFLWSDGVAKFMEFWQNKKKSWESSFKSGGSTHFFHSFIINGTAELSIFPYNPQYIRDLTMHEGFSHYYFCKQCIFAAFLVHAMNFQIKNSEIQLRRKLSLK